MYNIYIYYIYVFWSSSLIDRIELLLPNLEEQVQLMVPKHFVIFQLGLSNWPNFSSRKEWWRYKEWRVVYSGWVSQDDSSLNSAWDKEGTNEMPGGRWGGGGGNARAGVLYELGTEFMAGNVILKNKRDASWPNRNLSVM